jgi:hypothetical protein
MRVCLTTLLFLFTVSALWAQRFETKEINFRYVQFPKVPVKGVDHYNSTILLDYEQQNQALNAAYENELAVNAANYQQAMYNYQMDLEAAENEYKTAAVEYLDKETQSEVVFQAAMLAYNRAGGANSQLSPPLKQFVAKPVKRNVMMPVKMITKEPYYLKVFDTELLKKSYIKLEGLKEANEYALQIIITLKGFQKTAPQVKSKKVMSKNSAGESVSSMAYYGVIQAKHAIHVQIITPMGKTIMDELAVGSNLYISKNTQQFKTPIAAQESAERYDFLQKIEDELMRNNMNKLKNLLNDRFGYPIKSRRSYLRLFFHKKMTYPEYQTAYQNILLAYPKLNEQGQRAEFLQYANKAITQWEQAMRVSAPENKKARINKKVSRFTCLMLAEAHMWTDNFTKAAEYIAKMKVLKPLVNERRWMGELERLLASRKQRITAYNQAH